MVQVIFLGGEDHDGRVRHVANLAADMQPALTRQHQIEHDDLRLEIQERHQRFIAPVHHPYLETMLRQKMRDQPCQLFIVLNEQDLAQTQVFHKFSVWMRGLKWGHYRWQAGRQMWLTSPQRRSFMLLRVFNK